MPLSLNEVKNTFQKNIELVEDLLTFDELIQKVCLNSLRKAKRGLDKFSIDNPSFSVDKEISIIADIRSHGSLKSHYEIMYNQCVVLLVSYFASAVEDIFVAAFTQKFNEKEIKCPEKEEIKFGLVELQDISQEINNKIGEMVIAKKEISFQNMQSIARAFNTYLGFEPEKDDDVNNIILSQACRHCIVHNGGMLNEKSTKQISSAIPRGIKEVLKKDDKIQFQPEEIEIISNSMLNYIDKLLKGLTDDEIAIIEGKGE